MRLQCWAVQCFLGAVLVSGCSVDSPAVARSIRETDGVSAGVSLGSRGESVVKRYGKPALDMANLAPAHMFPDDARLPWEFDIPTSFRTAALRYKNISAVVRYRGSTATGESSHVTAIIVTAMGSETLRGVRVGQSLGAARSKYPVMRCGMAGGTNDTPEKWPVCVARVHGEYSLAFGGDPIVSITLADVALRP